MRLNSHIKPARIDAILAVQQNFPGSPEGFAADVANIVYVTLGAAPYEVGFDEAGNATFVRLVSYRPEGINKVYQIKMIWELADGQPGFQANSVIQLARKRYTAQMAQRHQ